MTSDRWQQVARVYHAVLEQAPADRGTYLASACAGDAALRAEVESLLAADNTPVMLDRPLADAAGSVLLDAARLLAPGTMVGSYRVLGTLGAGGMGEVYRARDTKLGRDVALKILPDAFVHDPDRLARFTREALILASLNHPHIAGIYGLEDSGPVHALVLELVEGPTLADRIARGALALEDALPIARQIADALEAAHDHGIVHRDLKPANIKVRDDGTVKVLDFGLAKPIAGQPVGPAGGSSAVELHPAVPPLTHSPTVVTPAVTRAGVILGTAAYMSPEQAKGRPADARSDIWAFGCVLFEMLTGTRAFEGDDVSDTLAAVLRADPPWHTLPTGTPPSIRRLLRRSLERDRRRRLADVADARLEIEDALHAPADEMARPAEPSSSRRRERVLWVVAVASLLAAAIAWSLTAARSTPAPEMRVAIPTPMTTDPMSLALSPDGQMIVFVGGPPDRSQLWLRRLDATAAQPLGNTDNAQFPFWSPDSRSIGFFADSKLKRIETAGGPAQVLANAPEPRGGVWLPDDAILFAPARGPLFRVLATGGDVARFTTLENELSHRFPVLLPDRMHYLLYVFRGDGTAGVFVGDTRGNERRHLVDADAAAMYLPPGVLLFVRQGSLFAQPFDAERLALTGNPVKLAEQIAVNTGAGVAALTTSATGHIAFRTNASAGQRQLVWLDRAGSPLAAVGNRDAADQLNASLSPDERRVALQRTVDGNTDVWLIDATRGVLSRMTSRASTDGFPVWSPDGRRLVFQSNPSGSYDLFMLTLDGSEPERALMQTPEIDVASDWSRDGRYLLYRSLNLKTGYDLWALPMTGTGAPIVVARTDFDERDGQFSPDGRWVAYQSSESGRVEVYVQSFPDGRSKWSVSNTGGAQVRWRRDGRELFYIALNGQLMSVPIQPAADGSLDIGTPVPLFATRIGGAVQTRWTHQYAVSADGQRFLMNMATEESGSVPITLILNWASK